MDNTHNRDQNGNYYRTILVYHGDTAYFVRIQKWGKSSYMAVINTKDATIDVLYGFSTVKHAYAESLWTIRYANYHPNRSQK